MASAPTTDVFEDVLNLEDRYYKEGYDLGVADGSQSGRIEGRIFGLEKGFEKFLEMGKLNGKAAVWEARLPLSSSSSLLSSASTDEQASQEAQTCSLLPKLSSSERLRKHIERLAALSDPNDLSTKNNEDDVSEFDNRLKDAKAKATLIARIVREDNTSSAHDEDDSSNEVQAGNAKGRAFRMRRNVVENAVAGRKTGEMEDFLRLPGRG